MSITQKSSPNYTAGRGGNTIKKIVVHHMVGTIESADRTFQDTVRGTSAHYGVAGDGRVWQWVPENSTAWHAGNFAINQQSIGIEHEDFAHDDFTETLYQTSAQLIAEICKRHNLLINANTIIPHRQIVATQCPGTIDLAKLISRAQSINQGNNTVNISQDEYNDLKEWKRKAVEELTPALADALAWKAKAINELQPKIDELEKQATDKATELKPGLYRVAP
jgi:N-acetyl-anhydromuramyl-L-alanine amidase AmpD